MERNTDGHFAAEARLAETAPFIAPDGEDNAIDYHKVLGRYFINFDGDHSFFDEIVSGLREAIFLAGHTIKEAFEDFDEVRRRIQDKNQPQGQSFSGCAQHVHTPFKTYSHSSHKYLRALPPPPPKTNFTFVCMSTKFRMGTDVSVHLSLNMHWSMRF